jgi:glycosyltransferase involved in cell wall biosynthesis
MQLRQSLTIPPDAPVIGMVARYDPIKRHHRFIEAAQLFIKIKPDARFILVGEGVDKTNTNLTRLIKAFSLEQHFHLLGYQSCLPDIYPAFDIHTLSSYSEGFPNVIGEAMACGVPSVTTDVGDAATIIGDTGKLVPVGQPQSLANAWIHLMGHSNEEKIRMNEAARNRIVTRFDIRDIVGRYASFYQGILEHVTSNE